MLRDAEKNKGAAQKKKATPSQDVSTLKEAGISHMESHRWQRVASVPEAEFEQHLTETREANQKDHGKTAPGKVKSLSQNSATVSKIDTRKELAEIRVFRSAIALSLWWNLHQTLFGRVATLLP